MCMYIIYIIYIPGIKSMCTYNHKHTEPGSQVTLVRDSKYLVWEGSNDQEIGGHLVRLGFYAIKILFHNNHENSHGNHFG